MTENEVNLERAHVKWQLDFLKYFRKLETEKMNSIAIEIFSYTSNINKDLFSTFVREAISQYNEVPYHNATHGINTLYNGFCFLKFLKSYNLKENLKMLFLICCFLHDVNHPGLNKHKTSDFELEKIHIQFTKNLLSKFLPSYLTDENINLVYELIMATNLLLDADIQDKFKKKYSVIENVRCNKEITTLELQILLKLADLGASYKDFDAFIDGSNLLQEEIFGQKTKILPEKIEGDCFFLKNYAIPLAKNFSDVFTEFEFLEKNAKKNLKNLLLLKKAE